MRRIHSQVKGIDPITGDRPTPPTIRRACSGSTCVEWHSFLAAYRAFAIDTLSPGGGGSYIAEGAPIAALLGSPEESVPRSVAEEARAYFESVRPAPLREHATREAIDAW